MNVLQGAVGGSYVFEYWDGTEWKEDSVHSVSEDLGYNYGNTLFLRNQSDENLTFAKAELETMYGKIVSDWKIENGKTILEVEIPPNSTAKVFVPNSYEESEIKEHNIGSGKYKFESNFN